MTNTKCLSASDVDSTLLYLFKHKVIIASYGDITPSTRPFYYLGKKREYAGARKEEQYLQFDDIIEKSITNGVLDDRYLSEKQLLNTSQKEQLKALFLAYRADPANNRSSVAQCYMPRNIIYFIDESEQVIAYLEICFQCSRSHFQVIGNTPELSDRCREIYSPLKRFFKIVGIEYGVTRNGIIKWW